DLHQVGPIRCAEEIAIRLHQATGIDPADSVKRFSEGRGIPLYLNNTMTQAQDLAAVLGHVPTAAASATISDSTGDTLTLGGVTASTLAANPTAVNFV
ncbi:hypothetical protein, partial [Roseiarcus sp.]|uniref:hypothetical protein n=1 Tax=Roseiarcus sp. TaxID=1969460 RepID=UPI003F9B9D28